MVKCHNPNCNHTFENTTGYMLSDYYCSMICAERDPNPHPDYVRRGKEYDEKRRQENAEYAASRRLEREERAQVIQNREYRRLGRRFGW